MRLGYMYKILNELDYNNRLVLQLLEWLIFAPMKHRDIN